MEYKIHNSWKRLEILSIVYKMSVDIKAFCYLNKYNLIEKLSKFIMTNNMDFLKFLFSPKPVRVMSYTEKKEVTSLARKISNYYQTCNLENSGYLNEDEIKIDIEHIKSYTDVCSVNRAIKKHNSVTGSKIPINVCYSEYELTRQDERIIRQKMMGLTIRRGKFILDFS
jgi:hypothetical protein|tara:strand:+ start:41 stop:547 length:507 start_codon:yes stop_codon:yes gene_type:complete